MKYKLITVLKLKCHCLFIDLQVGILEILWLVIKSIKTALNSDIKG